MHKATVGLFKEQKEKEIEKIDVILLLDVECSQCSSFGARLIISHDIDRWQKVLPLASSSSFNLR